MRLGCASLALVLLAPPSAHADDASATLSESEFIQRYERTEPRLEVAAADAARVDATVAAARRITNPEVQLEIESVGDASETIAGVGVSLDLGGRGARVDSARSRSRAAHLLEASTRWGLVVDALAAYYDAVRDRERVLLLENARAPLVQTVEFLSSQAKAGEIAGYERDRVELELARHDDRLADARGQYIQSQALLGELLGEPDARYGVSGSLAIAPPAALETLAHGAAANRADHRAAAHSVRAADHAATAAGRWWIPRIDLAGGAKTVSAGAVEDTGFFVRVALEVPLFDRNQAERDRAAADRRRERAAAEHLALTIRGEVRRAHEALTADLERLDTLDREQLARAEQLVDRAALVFREGEGSVVELLDAHRTALDVRVRRLELQHRAKQHQLDLWRGYGQRTDGEAP